MSRLRSMVNQSWLIYLLLSLYAMTTVFAYKASDIVSAAHKFPHLDKSFTLTSNTFELSSDYVVSVVVFPVFIIALGIISILIFFMLWTCRCLWTACCGCCKCLQCIPDDSKALELEGEKLREWRKRTAFGRNRLIWGYIISAILAFLAIHTTFVGNAYLNKGVRKESKAIGDVSDVFTYMADLSGNISSNAASIKYVLEDDACVDTLPSSYKDAYTATINSLISVTDSIENSINPLTKDMSKAQDKLIYYGIDVKTTVLMSFYAGIAFVMLLYGVAIFFREPKLTRILIFVTVFVVAALTILCGIETIILTVAGDICIDPSGNLQKVFPKGTSRDIITYYTECTGTNPLASKVLNTTELTAKLNAEINSGLAAYCGTDQGVQDAIFYVSLITNDLIDLVDYTTDCNTLYQIWNDGVNIGLCTDLFNGLFTLWVGEYVVGFGMYFTICIASVLYLYYGRLWAIRANDEGQYIPDYDHDERGCCGGGNHEHVRVHQEEEVVMASEVELANAPIDVSAKVIGQVEEKPQTPIPTAPDAGLWNNGSKVAVDIETGSQEAEEEKTSNDRDPDANTGGEGNGTTSLALFGQVDTIFCNNLS